MIFFYCLLLYSIFYISFSQEEPIHDFLHLLRIRSLSIFLDLSKAFDTLDHTILLSKLNHYGINGISYNLLSTYLTNKKQYVHFESSCSEMLDTQYGVPQGSIMGPLLVIIYINDFQNASKVSNL